MKKLLEDIGLKIHEIETDSRFWYTGVTAHNNIILWAMQIQWIAEHGALLCIYERLAEAIRKDGADAT